MSDELRYLEEVQHEQSGTDLPYGWSPGDFAYPDMDTDTADDHDDPFSDPDSDDYGRDEECVLVGLLGIEESPQFAPGLVDSFGHAAAYHVSKPQAGKTGLAKRDPVREDDFEEGPPRDAFRIIRVNAENLFTSDPRYSSRRPAAIDFFFSALDNGEALTFELCCRVLGARADILRLRIVYEFWIRHIQLDRPMSFMTVTVPEILQNEIFVYADYTGLAIANQVWNWPGIETGRLEIICAELGYEHTTVHRLMTRMQEEYVLSEQLGGWYLTGRNPILQSMRDQTKFGGRSVATGRQTVHWSRLF